MYRRLRVPRAEAFCRAVVDIVRQFDPDILTGYEVHNASWGYLIERSRMKFEYNLCDEISRMKAQSHGRFGKDADRWGFTHTSTIRVTGRHMINIWRAMRGERQCEDDSWEASGLIGVLHEVEGMPLQLLLRLPVTRPSEASGWRHAIEPNR